MTKYFDWAATSLLDDEVLNEYIKYSKDFNYNCSAIYTEGKKCKIELESMRKKVAHLLNVNSKYIYWTSGATESNNIILSSFLQKKSKKKILFLPIEHPSVLNPLQKLKNSGFTLTPIKIDKSGHIKIEDFKKQLDCDVQLVVIMAVNNEIGTIQDIEQLSKIVKNFSTENNCDIWFHCDAVQAIGKIKFTISENITSVAISGHKFCGPKGCGILYCKKDISPIFVGGGQEGGVRAGTENLPSIAATTKALEMHSKINAENIEKKKTLIDNLNKIPGVIIIPQNTNLLDTKKFSPTILQISIPKIPSEVILRLLNEKNFLVSNGSACSSNVKNLNKYVLDAILIDKETQTSAIRISFYDKTSINDINQLTEAINNIANTNKFLLKENK